MKNLGFPQLHIAVESSSRLDTLLHHSLAGWRGPGGEKALSVSELLELGSVYLNGKRVQQNVPVNEGDMIKAHPFPKRYPKELLSFKPKIVFENENFLVVDKPSPIPTHPTAANGKENLLCYLELQLGKKLYVTSRLDTDTEGLLIYAKSPKEQSRINSLFKNGRITKVYRALSQNPPAEGKYSHYQSPETGPRREFSVDKKDGWKHCEMIVHKTTPLTGFHLCEIELLTGRTHQIRGQMALIGCPILGDRLYNPSAKGSLQLECYSLKCGELFPETVETKDNTLIRASELGCSRNILY